MGRVKAQIGKEPYRVDIRSLSGNMLVADEPLAAGGKDAGFSPKELLASSLAACTSITMTMYAQRKGWMLEKAEVDVHVIFDKETNETQINRHITVFGDLSDEQKAGLLAIANKCPLHKILTNTIKIESTLK